MLPCTVHEGDDSDHECELGPSPAAACCLARSKPLDERMSRRPDETPPHGADRVG